jgi:hypothetical protein
VLLYDLKSRNMGLLMSLWSSLDRFTTWYTIFTLCWSFVTNNYSPSQLYCQCVHLIKWATTPLHCHSRATKRFQVDMPYVW